MSKYIVFTEYSQKTFKYNYFYLQYNDNENAIEQLNSMLIRAKYDTICGAYSEFVPIDIKYIIDKETLYSNFNKTNATVCNGKFILPTLTYSDNNTLGDLLNCYFYDGKIKTYFKE
jgi:hypothetical protein